MNLLDDEIRYAFCKDRVIPAVRAAAAEQTGQVSRVEKKGHGNFVTDADQRIERELKRRLGELLPDSDFLAEESGHEAKDNPTYRWIIDPIDGTTNFLYGFPYAVSVALEHIPTGGTLVGVVLVPQEDAVYYAVKGRGSYRIAAGREERIRTKPCADDEGIILFGLPYDRSKTEKIFSIAKTYYASCSDLKRIGPASLDICKVACGVAKLYFELDLHEWDIAAGVLILQEAGGAYQQKDDLMIFSAE